MHFFCFCLNVNIDVLEANYDQETVTPLVPVDIVQSANMSHEWILCELPFEQSVHVKWQNLFQTIPVREMKLNRCLGCKLYTHVTNVAPNRILINKDLLNDNTVQSAYNDPNYSSITKIILPSSMNSTSMTRLSNSQDENMQRECELGQKLYRQRIEDLERETEEKLRIYQREQEQLLETKKEHFNKELALFLDLMRSAPRQTSNAKSPPASQASSSYINENSTESGFGSDIFEIGAADNFSRHSSTFERAFSDRTTNLDDEINDEPIDNRGRLTDSSNITNFARSLPKQISILPSVRHDISRQTMDDDNYNSLERIGKSFRELSQSMCTDGTEVFGDLPSPPRHYTRQT